MKKNQMMILDRSLHISPERKLGVGMAKSQSPEGATLNQIHTIDCAAPSGLITGFRSNPGSRPGLSIGPPGLNLEFRDRNWLNGVGRLYISINRWIATKVIFSNNLPES